MMKKMYGGMYNLEENHLFSHVFCLISVNSGFEQHEIPLDVIWLDVDHTNGKRYFTWDTWKFPNPEKLQDDIAAYGRKMVSITDPHIKKDDGYHIYADAKARGYFVKNKEGVDYEGSCWPGKNE